MPAPTPIQIRYGMDPNALGELALATGTAQRRYSEYQTQLSADRSFVQNELNRRTEDTRYRNNFNLSLLGMQSDERIAREQANALQEASGYNQRRVGQTGVVSPITRGSQPVTLAPEREDLVSYPGAVEESKPWGSVSFREEGSEEGSGTTFFAKDGEIVQRGRGPVPTQFRGGFVGAGQQEGITRELRTTLNYIEGLRASGGYSEPLLNSMRVSARQGMGLSHIQRLADDGKSSGGGRRTAEETVADQYRRYAAGIRIADSLDTPEARDQARLDLMGVRDGFEQRRILNSDEGVGPVWDLYKKKVAKGVQIADPRPTPLPTITRRSTPPVGTGRGTPPPTDTERAIGQGTPGETRENPIQLSHPDEVFYLFSGAWFLDSRGRLLRKN